MNTRSVAELIFLIFGGAIVGITGEYWIEIAANDTVKPVKLMFAMSIMTSIMATTWIILFLLRNGNRLLGLISFVLIVIVIVFWFSLVIYIATRKNAK